MGVTITVSRSAAMTAMLSRRGVGIPQQRNWRTEDPPSKTIGELSPEDFGMRVVIRSGDFLGTVCGTLVEAHQHPSLVHFSCVQLVGKKVLTFRNDLDVIVVQDLHPREHVIN